MSPLDLLAALPLVVLLILGRSSRRRQLLLVASGAVVVELAFVVLYLLSGNAPVVQNFVITMGAILTLASWALLLYTALQAGRGRWLVAIAAVLAVTLGLPLLLPLQFGAGLDTVLVALSPLAALLFARSVPTTSPVARSVA